MENNVVLNLDDTPVRFTPDGKVFIIDAITALTENTNKRNAEGIWKSLSTENPEVMDLCEDFHFTKENPLPVADSNAWDKIQLLLFDHMMEM